MFNFASLFKMLIPILLAGLLGLGGAAYGPTIVKSVVSQVKGEEAPACTTKASVIMEVQAAGIPTDQEFSGEKFKAIFAVLQDIIGPAPEEMQGSDSLLVVPLEEGMTTLGLFKGDCLTGIAHIPSPVMGEVIAKALGRRV